VLALGIRYLNGFVAASEPDVRERPEWPPHPGRVFMALAAAHFQSGADPGERTALEWLESLPPPGLRASAATPRRVVTHYVPVNDKAVDERMPPTGIIQSIPQLARGRQPRTFARAWLEDEKAYLVWPDAVAADSVARALASLCGKVTRIGHSTSLVQMWIAESEEVGEVNWLPDDDRSELQLRVVRPGTLAELERRYNAAAVDAYTSLLVAAKGGAERQEERAAKKRLKAEFGNRPPQQLRPRLAFYQGYARPRTATGADAAGTVFSPHLLVFALEARRGPYAELDLRCVLAVADRWHRALVSQANDMPERIREVVSGHYATGEPLEGAHLAFLPLASVGHPHADGHLLGLAIALPADLPPEDRRKAVRVVSRVSELELGRLGVWGLVGQRSTRPPWNLRPEAWTALPDGATHWSTVTPVAFDRHPKAKDRGAYHREAAEMIAGACTAIGLPRPRDVILTPVSAHLGVPPAHAFPRLARKDGGERRHAHAILVFAAPVRGPVVIGAGRYRGYGVCRPLDAGGTV